MTTSARRVTATAVALLVAALTLALVAMHTPTPMPWMTGASSAASSLTVTSTTSVMARHHGDSRPPTWESSSIAHVTLDVGHILAGTTGPASRCCDPTMTMTADHCDAVVPSDPAGSLGTPAVPLRAVNYAGQVRVVPGATWSHPRPKSAVSLIVLCLSRT